MSAADHFTAFRDWLGGWSLASKVFDVSRFNGSLPVRDNYAIVRPFSPRLNDGRYTVIDSSDSTAVYRYDVRYIATSVAGVLKLQQAGRDRLLAPGGVRLTVAGRECDPIRLVPPVEEDRYTRDESADLFYVDDTYEFTSRRA